MKLRLYLALAALLVGLPGCSYTKQWWPGSKTLRVERAAHGAAASLSADEVVQAMRQAGFTDEEILEKGPELRNTLAMSGSARIAKGSTAEAIFAADAQKLYVSSRQSGSFSLPLESQQQLAYNPQPQAADPPAPDHEIRQPSRIHYASHQSPRTAVVESPPASSRR